MEILFSAQLTSYSTSRTRVQHSHFPLASIRHDHEDPACAGASILPKRHYIVTKECTASVVPSAETGSGLDKRPDYGVLEVELCLPIPEIVQLHPAKPLQKNKCSALRAHDGKLSCTLLVMGAHSAGSPTPLPKVETTGLSFQQLQRF